MTTKVRTPSDADRLTIEQRESLGRQCRDYENPLIACYAASIIGDSYPLPASQVAILLKDIPDVDLGYRFAKWCDGREKET